MSATFTWYSTRTHERRLHLRSKDYADHARQKSWCSAREQAPPTSTTRHKAGTLPREPSLKTCWSVSSRVQLCSWWLEPSPSNLLRTKSWGPSEHFWRRNVISFSWFSTTQLSAVLLHFLWQGAGIALLLYTLLKYVCTRRRSATTWRAWRSTLMLLAPPVTWFYLGSRPTLLDTTFPPAQPSVESGHWNERGRARGGTACRRPRPPSVAGETTWTRFLVAFWGAGVLLLCIRLAGAWIVLRRLVGRSRATYLGSVEQRARVPPRPGRRYARSVRLLLSSRVPSPLTFGWLRPVIVLPYSAVTGLPIQQLEAVLAHELAHIQRHDYLVGVLQTLIETLLFYHPAVWWTSRTIRREREHLLRRGGRHALSG